ncbi:MAG: hypothetical protein M3P48_08160 [Actinomycetota bacterium]|nr:hypothetical protein [Actinomycetota bacterium]
MRWWLTWQIVRDDIRLREGTTMSAENGPQDERYGATGERAVPSAPEGVGAGGDAEGVPGTGEGDPLAGVRVQEVGGDMPSDQATAAGTPDAGPVSSREAGEGRA